MHRPDGRTGGASLRPLSCELSCLNRPDGSAKFSCGSTQVLAAIYGPAAPRQTSKENPSHGILAVVFKQAYYGVDTKASLSNRIREGNQKGQGLTSGGGAHIMTEREMERFIGEALSSCICLHQYPKCVIEIVIQVMKADGSVVGASLNAAVLALLDAGIQMTSLPIATTLCLDWNSNTNINTLKSNSAIKAPNDENHDKNQNMNHNDNHLMQMQSLKLDPVAEEEIAENSSVIVLVTDSVNMDDGIISSITLGPVTPTSFLSCISASSTASKALLAFIRLAIQQKCIRESQTLWSN